MRKNLLVLALITAALLPALCFASGEGAATLYNQGNALYARGDYEGAVKSYLHALDQRVEDPRLEQNIGSAYLKLGLIGRAIYHFERGLLLSPRDPDLRHDLEFARQLRRDEVPENAGLFVTQLFGRIIGSFTPGETVGAFAALFVAFLAVLWAVLLVQGRGRPVLIWCAVALFALLSAITPFTAYKLYRHHFADRAVIVSEEVAARTGPGENQQEAFVVHGGMGCTILERRAGWSRINIETGFSGWVQDRDVKKIAFE